MDAGPVILPLKDAGDSAADLVGGKARSLGRLMAAGYRVPDGFCITAHAYHRFVRSTGLARTIGMELGRKPLSSMRWEELWDAALRIRSAFLKAPIPDDLAGPIRTAYRELAPDVAAVRSSAPGEDSSQRSYAGLHESLVGVAGEDELLDAVRVVWASLWSDAALLYRKELDLDVTRSRMAVIVQEFIPAPVSGVGFGIDPLEPEADRQILEAVPGSCEGLVSGEVDPDRWMLERSSGELLEWRMGERGSAQDQPLLDRDDLALLHRTLHSIEELLGSPPDMEWTGQSGDLTVLQARPITTAADEDEERTWYLSLRPGTKQLQELCARVSEELIPALEAEAADFAGQELASLSDDDLATALEERLRSLERWQSIYKEDFIPFAHGVRHFGVFYNDVVRPSDPYEFVDLLRTPAMLASQRNRVLTRLASLVRENAKLEEALTALDPDSLRSRQAWSTASSAVAEARAGEAFRDAFETLLDRHLDMTFDGEPLDERPDLALKMILELAHAEGPGTGSAAGPGVESAAGSAPESAPGPAAPVASDGEERLLEAVGPDRAEEARELLRIARLSWRLRDDDNVLIGRLENQVYHALNLAADRLREAGRLDPGPKLTQASAQTLADALQDHSGGQVRVSAPSTAETTSSKPGRGTPRQLIGQPAARGLATGRVRVIRDAEDLGRFRQGEVIVCDAVQPTMTHLVPLAAAIVERRGGMLIHGAIIARELGVPCVNGVPRATAILHDGELVTVDGQLGIVTVGPPDFDMETGPGGPEPRRPGPNAA